MDEKNWLFLQVLYEEQNITRAAERLYISQPALTYRIQNIEEEFNIQLIYRTKKGIKFTPEGEHLLHFAQDMLKHKQRVKEQLANLGHEVQGPLRLGVASNFAYYKLPQLLKSFLQQYPKVQINLYTGLSYDIVQLVNDENLHIGIIRGDYKWPEQKHVIDQETLCIIAKEEFTLTDLPSIPKIDYKTDPLLKKTIDQWWQENFTQPPLVTMVVDNVEICKAMVQNGLGYAVVPNICLKEDDQLFQHTLAWADGSPLVRKTWLIYNTTSATELKTVQAFVEFMM